jgi:uncharacterized SAM-binding protein YcdF (DUF218 family)
VTSCNQLGRLWFRLLSVTCAAALVALVVIGVSGYLLFSRAADDPMQAADAVVVLGSEHDGREAYGWQLVLAGSAPVLVLSNPYPESDTVMRRMCRQHADQAEVLCERPKLSTTEGEAAMTRRLATARGWQKVIIVTWRYHLPRARFIFSKCLAWSTDRLVLRAVPRNYAIPLVWWEYVYAYQFMALAKAKASDLASCTRR